MAQLSRMREQVQPRFFVVLKSSLVLGAACPSNRIRSASALLGPTNDDALKGAL
ncbi:hypothetical protein [uncultured Ruegeria sp.]|uniref:hypothetical protein n=1 Tax=uncultured Ruegeria sp. TaxID=259304 RepID=UPI002601DA2A|nr:hypothetical protein [uncultured Ruegeria sp.]